MKENLRCVTDRQSHALEKPNMRSVYNLDLYKVSEKDYSNRIEPQTYRSRIISRSLLLCSQ